MSKKSAYKPHRKPQEMGEEVIEFTRNTWNALRSITGAPQTGEPVPYEACLALAADQAACPKHLWLLVCLVAEAWRDTYPFPPQTVTLVD